MSSTYRTPAPKILIVDDVPANLLALHAVLGPEGCELIEATSGVEAIAHCQIHEFALIILDVHMPHLDGYQTALAIKDSSKNRNCPIIFLTATFREEPHMQKGYAVGAVDYIGKPFNPEIFKMKVSIYTDLYRKTKQLEMASRSALLFVDLDGEIYETNEEGRKFLEPAYKEMLQVAVRKIADAGDGCHGEAILDSKFTGFAHPLRNRSKELCGVAFVFQITDQITEL